MNEVSVIAQPKFRNLIGCVFGKITVVDFADSIKNSDGKSVRMWKCQCECGTVKNIRSCNLQRGGSLSCGCVAREKSRQRATHGYARGGKTPREYWVWVSMHQRCENENNKSFRNYGGRGIKVCERWESFGEFMNDMGYRPSSRHTIERIDNDGHYSPDNCRWATRHDQSRNTRQNHLIAFNGTTQCLADWAYQLGMSFNTLEKRLRDGWTEEDALTTPVVAGQKRKNRAGTTLEVVTVFA